MCGSLTADLQNFIGRRKHNLVSALIAQRVQITFKNLRATYYTPARSGLIAGAHAVLLIFLASLSTAVSSGPNTLLTENTRQGRQRRSASALCLATSTKNSACREIVSPHRLHASPACISECEEWKADDVVQRRGEKK